MSNGLAGRLLCVGEVSNNSVSALLGSNRTAILMKVSLTYQTQSNTPFVRLYRTRSI